MGNTEKADNGPLNILIVLDEGVNWTIVNQTLKKMQGCSVDFFSLTGKYMSLSGIRRELSPELDLNLKFLSSGKSIDEALESLRPEILRWSLEMGDLRILGKLLKR